MAEFFNIEWLNACSQRSYPFATFATRQDVTASVTVPDDFLLELYLPVAASAELPADSFFIQTLAILGGGFLLNIAYNDGSDAPPVIATCSISAIGFLENSMYALTGINAFSDTRGKLVIGSLTSINKLPAGVYQFTPAGGMLDPDAIRPMIRGLTSLAVQANGTLGPQLYNNIVLSAGSGIRLTTIIQSGQDPKIRIDAIPGVGFSTQCPNGPSVIPCIRLINGIPGDAQQNFSIVGDNCLQVTSGQNTINLTDTCCQPCCGCNELAEIVRVLRDLQSTSTTLEAYSQNLATNINVLQTTISVSQIGSGNSDRQSGGGISPITSVPCCPSTDPSDPVNPSDPRRYCVYQGMTVFGAGNLGLPLYQWKLQFDYCANPERPYATDPNDMKRPRGNCGCPPADDAFVALWGLPYSAQVSIGLSGGRHLTSSQSGPYTYADFGNPGFLLPGLKTNCTGCTQNATTPPTTACANYCIIFPSSLEDWAVQSGFDCVSPCVCTAPAISPRGFGVKEMTDPGTHLLVPVPGQSASVPCRPGP